MNTVDTIFRPTFATVSQFPGAVGRVFYVDGFNGVNASGRGQDPSAPLLTIAYALTQCTNAQQDYIIVLDHWQEAVPIVVGVTTVHIIGVGVNPTLPFVCLNANADELIFDIIAAGDEIEIANFCLGGGATTGAIGASAGGPYGCYIHHCIFGHPNAGNTPQYGIHFLSNMNTGRISNNKFLGNGGNCAGTITGDGIWLQTGPFNNCEIIDNIFMGLDICINATNADSVVIAGNIFALNANTAGGGVTLQAACAGCVIANNVANNLDTTMAANPYVDTGNASHWMNNKRGGAATIAVDEPWIMPT